MAAKQEVFKKDLAAASPPLFLPTSLESCVQTEALTLGATLQPCPCLAVYTAELDLDSHPTSHLGLGPASSPWTCQVVRTPTSTSLHPLPATQSPWSPLPRTAGTCAWDPASGALHSWHTRARHLQDLLRLAVSLFSVGQACYSTGKLE